MSSDHSTTKTVNGIAGTLSARTLIPIGTAVAIALVVIQVARWDASYRTKIDAEMEHLRQQVCENREERKSQIGNLTAMIAQASSDRDAQIQRVNGILIAIQNDVTSLRITTSEMRQELKDHTAASKGVTQ